MRIIVDSETGQILDVLPDGSRILKGSSIQAFKELEGIPKGETFTKLYHGMISKLMDVKLTSAELSIFIYLAGNLRYQSNVAKYQNGKLINRKSIEDKLCISEVTVKRSILRLIREGLIVEARTVEDKCFIINPFVVMVGDKVNKTVFDLFRKSAWARW